MNLAGKYRRKEKVAKREIGGEFFLIPVCGTPVDMNSIFVLNPVAEFIWQRLDGEKTLDAVVTEIVEEFDVTAKQANADAVDFVGRLLQHDLVEEKR